MDGRQRYILSQPIGTETYTFAAEAQSFAYEKKVAKGISVGGGIVSQLYSGIDGPSVVVVGTQIGAGVFGRGTAGKRLGPVHGAVYLDATYGPRYGILVLEAIEQALNGRRDTASAFTQSNAWTVTPGVAAAWAPHPSLGITGSTAYRWVSLDTTTTSRQNQSGVDVALAADLDLGYWTGAPVAVIGGWSMTAPLGSDGVARVIDYSAGAYYTGRPALALGLELGVAELHRPGPRLGRDDRADPHAVLLVKCRPGRVESSSNDLGLASPPFARSNVPFCGPGKGAMTWDGSSRRIRWRNE